MNKQIWLLGIASVLIVVLLLAIFFVNQQADEVRASQSVAPVNTPADTLPQFQLLDSMSQQQLVLKDIVGKKMLLNVWATWCVACRQEHSFLNHLAEKGVRIIGLNYRDRPQLVDTWFAELGNPYDANLLDVAGRLGEQLPVVGAPETYFIDAKGVIQHKHSGIISQSHWDAGLSKIYNQMQ